MKDHAPQVYIGIDDTDVPGDGGTGRVARELAARLSASHTVRGVTRHQLLVDPRIPYTQRNSANVVHLSADADDCGDLPEMVRDFVAAAAHPDSAPGVCVAAGAAAAASGFGRRVQREVVTQQDALAEASAVGAHLLDCGSRPGGAIGALAGATLAAGGSDGRFVDHRACRQVTCDTEISWLLGHAVDAIVTEEEEPVRSGMVAARRGLRPAVVGHRAVLYVRADGPDRWLPLRGDDGAEDYHA